jgi:hypothetical protein
LHNPGAIASREREVISIVVIACDKREAFAQGSDSDEAIQLSVPPRQSWIASLALAMTVSDRSYPGCLKFKSLLRRPGQASASRDP